MISEDYDHHDEEEDDDSNSSKHWETKEEKARVVTNKKYSLHEMMRAVASLSYAIALTDDCLQDEEKQGFMEAISRELGDDAWAASSRFDLLEKNIRPNLEHAYNAAIYQIRQNKKELTPELKQKFITVMHSMADAYGGSSQGEKFVIKRFEKDMGEIMNEKKNK